jgi:hypothetical protein
MMWLRIRLIKQIRSICSTLLDKNKQIGKISCSSIRQEIHPKFRDKPDSASFHLPVLPFISKTAIHWELTFMGDL